MPRTFRTLAGERGAAAVEMAFVLPLLLLLVFGMIEFGRAYNAQISLTAATREGARVMAIHNDPARARSATVDAAPSLSPKLSGSQISISPSACSVGQTVHLTATYPVSFTTPMFGTSVTLTGKGVMRCGG